MALDACINEVARVVGRELTGAEREAVEDRIKNVLGKIKRAERMGGDVEAEINKIIAQDIQTLKNEALIAKRQTAINARVKMATMDYLTSTWDDDPAEGIKALISGSLADRPGAKNSVAARTDTGRQAKMAAFTSELERADLVEAATSGEFDLEIRKAARALDTGGDLKGLSSVAVDLARIYKKHLDVLRQEMNNAGAWVGKINGYVGRQSHDQWKIAKAAGTAIPIGDKRHYNAWRSVFTQLIDWDRSMPDVGDPKQQEDILFNQYEKWRTGHTMSFQAPVPRGTGKGFANIGKRHSHDRTWVFKSPEAEHEYAQRFGEGNSLFDGVVSALNRGGRDLAIMRQLGPNAEQNLRTVALRWEKHLADKGEREKAKAMRARFDQQMGTTWKVITGASATDDSLALAMASETALNVQRMADLGGMVLSSSGDIVNAASHLNFYGDRSPTGFFAQTRDLTGHMLSVLGRGAGEDQRAIAAENGILLEATYMPHSNVISDSAIPGRVAKWTQYAFKYFGAEWWSNNLRIHSFLATASRFSAYSSRVFDTLPDGMRAALSHYQISPAEWDLIRQAKPQDYRGRPVLTSQSLMELSETVFAGSTPAQRRAKEALVDKFRNMASDLANTAVTAPSATVKAITTQGTSPGTWQGFALRHWLLYKSYAIGFMRNHLGRELHSYHPDRVGTPTAIARAVTGNGKGSLMGITGLIGASLFAGHISEMLWDLASGKEIQPVPTNAEEAAQVFGKAFARSGAIGLYGDVVMGFTKDHFTGEDFLINVVGGPSARRVAQFLDGVGQLKEGDWDAFNQKLWRTAWNTVPGRNLFYTRWLTDYLVNYRVSEMLNPGYLERMEDQMEARGERWLVPPSSVIPYGG